MPAYDYECPKCCTIIEVTHRMSETPDVLCPSCGKVRMTKAISMPQFNMGENPGTGLHEEIY